MRASGRNSIVPLLAAAVGITLALTVRNQLADYESEITTTEFELDAQGVVSAFQKEIATAEETVLALRAFYAGSEKVSAVEFGMFAKPILSNHPEIGGFTWAEESAKNPRTYPILFAEPSSIATLGDDLAGNPSRLAVLERASRSASPSAMSPVDGSILVLARAATSNREQDGVVAASIEISKVAGHAMDQFLHKGLGITIVDSNGAEPVLLYPAARAEIRGLRSPVSIGGRSLDVYVVAGPSYIERRDTDAPLVVMLAILSATALAVGYVWVLQNRTVRIERLVDERTSRIREVTRFQEAILKSAEYAIFAFDTAGTVLAFNPAAERMLQYRADEVVSRKSAEAFFDPSVLRDHAAQEGLQSGREVLLRHAGEGVTDPWIFRRSDGTTFAGSLSISALRDETNRVAGYLAMGRDITERLEAEEALRSAKSQAEDASRTKSRFLANMSHELRTPLTAILGYAEMLEEDAEAAGAKQSQVDLGRIREAGRHLLRLIDDVLDLSKVEAGRMELRPETLDLVALMDGVAMTVRPLAESRGNKVEVRGLEGSVNADPTRLRQILLNLAANAARFTENGTIILEAERDGDCVVFRVRDTGIGMTEDQLARVFAPFEQADASVAAKHGGTGLGLAIAREFTELMGGDLQVESEPGAGSEFRVRVPGALA
jgi:PAS domain S-box-containing protein